MAAAYQQSPTPSHAFPALKTPPPELPVERQAGAYVVRESIAERLAALSLESGEEMLALSARLTRMRRRFAAISAD